MEASLTGAGGQRTDLTSNTLTIGRAPDNQLVVQDQQASSHHAEIQPDAQGYLLVDMNSRNGTFVNEQRLMPQTPRLLISGDVIRIGEMQLTYLISGANEATMRANAGDYANPGYSPTVAVPPPAAMPDYNQPAQPGYANYQQPAPGAPDFQQPAPPAYSGYQQPQPPPQPQQPAPFAPNYPQANQPGYNQSPQAYPTPVYQPPQGYPQQAPGAGAPGQFGAAPAVAQPRKRRGCLVIGLIVLLLLIVVGAIGGFLYASRSTPDKTLQAYCTALQNGDAQGAYNQLSGDAQSKTSVAKINQGLQLFKNPLIGGIKSCTYNNVQQNGSTATADLLVTFGNSTIPSKPTNVTLVDENGAWKLNSSSSQTTT